MYWKVLTSQVFEGPTGEAACDAWGATVAVPFNYTGGRTFEHTIGATDGICKVVDQYKDGGSSKNSQKSVYRYTRTKEHTDECAQLAGSSEWATLPSGGGAACAGGCAVSEGFAMFVADGLLTELTYSGEACPSGESAELPRPYTQPTGDGSTNTYTDEAGATSTYPAPAPPPADADPATAGDQPPVPTASTTDPGSGTTVDEFPMVGGGSIFVVRDGNGNVTYTDQRPTTGSGDYAAPGGGGGDDGGGGIGGGECTGSDCGDGEEPASVNGGAVCDSAPSCSGDAVGCALLFQSWRTRCELETEADEDLLTASGPAQEIDQLLDGYRDGFSDLDGAEARALVDAAGMDASGDIAGALTLGTGGASNCAGMGGSVYGASLDLSSICGHYAIWRATMEWVVWIVAATGLWFMWGGTLDRVRT